MLSSCRILKNIYFKKINDDNGLHIFARIKFCLIRMLGC